MGRDWAGPVGEPGDDNVVEGCDDVADVPVEDVSDGPEDPVLVQAARASRTSAGTATLAFLMVRRR
ncbi:hypothetical protein CKY47_17060 [Saccharothrix yanglingensis]|uniref:Uncharacterized protein n=1 Tax=Saccharothrix yanglingensis TaxID=659496 RepID=A0ABU0X0K4_9PSEU|nr:hypothetical protein [Saccharothrix yanglingensis]